MGVYLSTPSLATDGEFASNEFFTFSSCSMQGWRSTQEDDCLAVPEVNEVNSSALFAVFDGHGGSSVSKFCALHFLDYLNENESFKKSNVKMNDVLRQLFLHCDEQVAKTDTLKELEELSKADEDEEQSDSSEGDALEETCLEDKEEEIKTLCEEANEDLEKIAEKYSLDEESKELLEQRRKSSASSKTSTSKDDKEKKSEENGEEEEEEESDDDSDYTPPESETEEGGENSSTLFEALSNQFNTKNIPGQTSGCTACVLVLVPDLTTKAVRLFVANAGDSRAVLSRSGKAIDLSCDHKPETKCEKDRISAAGGVISADGRVNGGLNLSRAIGDHTYKQREDLSLADQMITSNPDVTDTVLSPETDEFAVIACDGVWNVMTSQEVVDFVSARLKDPSLIGKERKPYSMFTEAPQEEGEEKNGHETEESGDKSSPEKMEKQANGDEKEEVDGEGEDEASEEEQEDSFVDEEVEYRDGPGMLKEIAVDLFHACISETTNGDGTGCDNMSCIIVKFDDLEQFAKKAAVECGPVVEVKLPENDETEVIERRKRTLSGDSSETSSSEVEEDQEEVAKEPVKKKLKKADANGDSEPVKENGVH